MMCSVEGCDRAHVAKGYCRVHYYQVRRTGVAKPIVTPTRYNGASCDYPSCRLPVRSNGLCDGHETQRRKGKSLGPLRRRGLSLVRDDQGRKLCQGCDQWKTADDQSYAPSRNTADRLETRCRSCRKNTRLLTTYNMTRDQYDDMLARQNGTCAISGCTREVGSYGRELHVDHDHACCPDDTSCGKCVRGLLCHQHNAVLGFVNDSVSELLSLVTYLTECQVRG